RRGRRSASAEGSRADRKSARSACPRAMALVTFPERKVTGAQRRLRQRAEPKQSCDVIATGCRPRPSPGKLCAGMTNKNTGIARQRAKPELSPQDRHALPECAGVSPRRRGAGDEVRVAVSEFLRPQFDLVAFDELVEGGQFRRALRFHGASERFPMARFEEFQEGEHDRAA